MIKPTANAHLDQEAWTAHAREAQELILNRRWEQDLRYGDSLTREYGFSTWLVLLVEAVGQLAASLPERVGQADSRCLDRAIDVAGWAQAFVEVASRDVYGPTTALVPKT